MEDEGDVGCSEVQSRRNTGILHKSAFSSHNFVFNFFVNVIFAGLHMHLFHFDVLRKSAWFLDSRLSNRARGLVAACAAVVVLLVFFKDVVIVMVFVGPSVLAVEFVFNHLSLLKRDSD